MLATLVLTIGGCAKKSFFASSAETGVVSARAIAGGYVTTVLANRWRK